MESSEAFETVLTIPTPFFENREALDDRSRETSPSDDLEGNSDRLVSAALEFEDTFDIEIANDRVDDPETVADAIERIEPKSR